MLLKLKPKNMIRTPPSAESDPTVTWGVEPLLLAEHPFNFTEAEIAEHDSDSIIRGVRSDFVLDGFGAIFSQCITALEAEGL